MANPSSPKPPEEGTPINIVDQATAFALKPLTRGDLAAIFRDAGKHAPSNEQFEAYNRMADQLEGRRPL